jgi:hypothetical protein
MLDQYGAIVHPVAVVDVPDWTRQSLFDAVTVTTDNPVGAMPPDRLYNFSLIETGGSERAGRFW